MAFPHKGSSAITVDGVEYRWRVRSRPTYCQGALESWMTFAVQTAHDPRTVLLVTVDALRPDNWIAENANAITPALVAHCIRIALADGWRPNANGSAFSLTTELPA
ncbi:hypothetical protein RBSH_02045 [Rhodopirellula baltica SH28]|uniref:Uncharacterized protein n=1 Tax=Rhodopirellula baltica SH28 TaxID=993517 RepID=K5CFD3_RHOBT|nr:hypothetical protein [Rhodopirellula baltica]EKK02630.1 hypothetical protein RBSH_02045 [Rhodopirellula baltica SH28]